MIDNLRISKNEKQLLFALEDICKRNEDITNLFVFGSRSQSNLMQDKFSDLDIMILTNKPIILPLNLKHFVYYEAIDNCNTFVHYDFVLQDFQCGSIFIITEKKFKKILKLNPFIWGSIICKGTSRLLSKNNFLDNCYKFKIQKPDLIGYITNDLIGSLIFNFSNLLRVKLRQENSQTYFYSQKIHILFEKLFTLKLQYSDYCKYKRLHLSTFQLLSFYDGRHFEKYATLRQKNIMNLLYCITSIPKEKMINLLDLIYDEVKECINLCLALFDYQSLDNLKIYTSSRIMGTNIWNEYSKKQRTTKEKQYKKILKSFVTH